MLQNLTLDEMKLLPPNVLKLELAFDVDGQKHISETILYDYPAVVGRATRVFRVQNSAIGDGTEMDDETELPRIKSYYRRTCMNPRIQSLAIPSHLSHMANERSGWIEEVGQEL
jgi:hypothetical protein